MMNAKNTMAMAVCAAAAMLPHATAEAASGRAALEACVSALAMEISNSQGSGVEARISDESRYGPRRLDGPTTFSLDARDPRTDEIVLKADCLVNRRGKVRNLITLPAEAPETENRSL